MTRLIPLNKWKTFHPWPSERGLRNYVFYEKENGFHKCVKRVQRRVLIDEEAFFAWVNEQNELSKAAG